LAKVKGSVWLNAGPEEVWPFLVEPDKLTRWLTEMHYVEWPDEGPISLGSRYNVDKEIRGQVRRYNTEVTRWEEGRAYGFVSESPGFSRVDGIWEITPEGDGCRLEMRETITLANPNLVVDWFVKRGATKAIQGFLVKLKHLVEHEEQADALP
jgi:hypothetical protein